MGGDNVAVLKQTSMRAMAVAALCAVLVAAMTSGNLHAASPADAAYTIGKYPVDAVAADAVTAKDKALADGQQAALRSLFKRLVPVTHYARINRMKPTPRAADYIDGVSVQSERNSSTQYIASLDFSFRVQAIRDLLKKQGIPFVDSQSPPVAILPVYRAPATAADTVADGERQWSDAWKALDHDHALTPLRLAAKKPQVHADTVDGVIAGDGGMMRVLTREYGSDLVVVAVAEPDPSTRKVTITIAGQDSVGAFSLKRTYRYAAGDLGYTLELASVIALGTLEGRWKALKSRGIRTGSITTASAMPVQLFVEYKSLQEWSDLREAISSTPGVQDLQIGGVAPRGADIALMFPGGPEPLAEQLRAQGLDMQGSGSSWTVRGANR